jgi:hypothetical protein
MTNPSYPSFWRVTYPTGRKSRYEAAKSEQEARAKAQRYSLSHGPTTITNREGLVATYISGEEHWFKNR